MIINALKIISKDRIQTFNTCIVHIGTWVVLLAYLFAVNFSRL